jgi:ribosomal protein S18 acetylase RimI-like enzyme
MIDRALLARIRIEPLDRSKHDRAAFSCGEERVDNFLKKTAARRQDNDLTRVNVACLDADNAIIGYYALNAHSVDVSTLPDEHRKSLPSYPAISAIYLSVVGVHKFHQGGGVGSFLLADAFKRCAEAADIIGAHYLVLDALNERAARLYRSLGFVDLPGHEPRMLITIGNVRKAIAAARE